MLGKLELRKESLKWVLGRKLEAPPLISACVVQAAEITRAQRGTPTVPIVGTLGDFTYPFTSLWEIKPGIEQLPLPEEHGHRRGLKVKITCRFSREGKKYRKELATPFARLRGHWV